MGKSSKPTIGFWYHVAYHHGLTIGPIDAFLEMRGGSKVAWQGVLTASGTININQPNLWGGEKDQGGIVGDLAVMFGEETQVQNAYLVSVFGNQTAAWRGFATVAFLGGRYGAMNPYPQAASYKIRRIKQGWDGGVCWYPEKAEIPFTTGTGASSEGYFLVPAGAQVGNLDVVYGSVSDGLIATAHEIGQRCIDTRNTATGSTYTLGESYVYWNGEKGWWEIGAYSVELGPGVGIAGVHVQPTCPIGYTASFVQHGSDSPLGPTEPTVSCTVAIAAALAINPAHVLYESRTNGDMGRESTLNINDASLRAAADKLYAEGFGICPQWDPASESVEDFEQRICKLIGGSFSRSLEDGQWYLDLARGDYVLADLPILTDDDILDFKEQPTTFDSAINSVSVRYFDPERKETVVTPPVRALGLVAAFGTIHQTYDYPEIPTADLATRVALRELLATTTPTRAFELVTTRRTYAWRPNQYFRLQVPKRGIADMVCLVGEKQSGTLKSGAIKLKAMQDIYALPTTSFVEVEPGVDPAPPAAPNAITLERALEAPYVLVAASLSRADLAALPPDVGYAMAVAVPPAGELDYTMMVASSGGTYADAGRGEWCASAAVNETAGLSDTGFTLSGGIRLDQVAVGMGVLWESEIARVDAIDITAGTITLARGCADTVPAPHSAGSRLWFYEVGFAYDTTEYTAGETVNIKLLSNTGSQQLALPSATAMAIAFDQRQVRPYPPGRLRFTDATQTGVAYPVSLSGAVTTSWAHRDRVLQADQLVDTTATSTGPEAGTTYTVAYEQPAGTVVHTESGITGTAATPYTFPADAEARITVTAVRDGLNSWQALAHDFAYLIAPTNRRIVVGGDARTTASGNYRITRG